MDHDHTLPIIGTKTRIVTLVTTQIAIINRKHNIRVESSDKVDLVKVVIMAIITKKI